MGGGGGGGFVDLEGAIDFTTYHLGVYEKLSVDGLLGPGVAEYKTCFKSHDIFRAVCDTPKAVIGLIHEAIHVVSLWYVYGMRHSRTVKIGLNSLLSRAVIRGKSEIWTKPFDNIFFAWQRKF